MQEIHHLTRGWGHWGICSERVIIGQVPYYIIIFISSVFAIWALSWIRTYVGASHLHPKVNQFMIVFVGIVIRVLQDYQ